ncbi:MAG: PTS sugar transporter subunit IIA [Chthoniobacterales bacterium]|nr:PTS sugar transporter subunit IIA [Chthoniobacterales bacterium]
MTESACGQGKIKADDRESILTSLQQRQERMSTGIAFGIAVPHASSDVSRSSSRHFGVCGRVLNSTHSITPSASNGLIIRRQTRSITLFNMMSDELPIATVLYRHNRTKVSADPSQIRHCE